MSADATTIARPYAEAVFMRAVEGSALGSWSDELSFLNSLVENSAMAEAISNPLVDRDDLADLIIDVGGEALSEEGKNLTRLLAQNNRLNVLPEIAALFETLKAEKERTIQVEVRSAFDLQPQQEQQIAAALKAKLGRDVTIISEQDPDLIGGLHIRAGDLVVDGSVRGKLQQLANELGI